MGRSVQRAAGVRPSQVRVIGGRHRGRKLPVADAPGLRPTPDRVRETLFNWLGQNLAGWHCLDLFAGSGALGFEAVSRGAASVTLVEQAPRVAKSLQAAATLLNEPGVQVVCADALAYLARPAAEPLDLVFLDPPYGQGWLDRIIMPLLPHLADGARLYMESEQPLPAQPAPGLSCIKQGKAGQVHYHLYAYALPTGSA
ncbi:MAG: 16S rRNA (guanine(966)-N(2))-methyltransferase RsmD [Fluviibacter sp.]